MTSDEFNKKYKDYLEPQFEGMEIEHPGIIKLCDEYFKEWIKVPGFQYAQIKTKFGTSRVYCDPFKYIDTYALEADIDKILKGMNYENSKS